MVNPRKTTTTPLTFDLGADLQAKLQTYQRLIGARSTSSVIRYAIQQFSFSSYSSQDEPHRQLSVRLPDNLKEKLLHFSKQKSVSVGELLRAALGALPDQPNQDLINHILDTTMATKKKNAKAVKKAAPKKKVAVKKAVKKAAPKKKAAVKKAAKKAAPKKKAAKKAVITTASPMTIQG